MTDPLNPTPQPQPQQTQQYPNPLWTQEQADRAQREGALSNQRDAMTVIDAAARRDQAVDEYHRAQQAENRRLDQDLHQPDWLDVAKATWQLDTITGQALLNMGVASAIPETGTPSDSFDPFAYYEQNKGRYGHVSIPLSNGSFDNVRSEDQFRRTAEVIRQNQEAREQIAMGQGGSMIANMAASLLDLPTILSFGTLGAAVKGGLALRTAVGAGTGFLDAAASEVALQGMDPTRKAEEAWMNIGTGVFIGAGMGALFKHLPPDSPLRPGHPENPMNPDFIHPVNEHQVGTMPEDGISNDIRAGHVGGSAGAMVARTGDDAIATGGSVHSAIDRALSAPTPLGRMNGYVGSGQSAIAQLFDLGGLMLEKNKRGIAHPPEAEAYLTMYKHEGQAVVDDLGTIYRQANLALNTSKVSHAAGAVLDQVSLGSLDTRAVTRSLFFDLVDDHLSAKMGGDYDFNRLAREKLKTTGLTDENATHVLTKVGEASDAASKHFDSMMNEAERIGLADPKDRKANYGKPMIYLSRAIDENQGAMRAIALRHFSDKPNEAFLVEHGYIKDPMARPVAGETKVTGGPVHATWDDLVKSGDLKLQGDILTHYRGTTEDAATEQATQRVMSAQQTQLRATNEFEVISDGLQGAKADLKDATLKKMKARVREVEANWHARNLASKQQAIAEADETIRKISDKYPNEHGTPVTQDSLADMAGQNQRTVAKTGTDISSLTDALQGSQGRKDSAGIREKTATIQMRSAQDVAEHAAAMAERDAATTARRNATMERDQAMAQLTTAAKGQRDAQQFVEEAVNDSHKLGGSMKTAEQRAGVESMLVGERERLDKLGESYRAAEQAWKEAGDIYRGNRTGLKMARSELAQSVKELRRAVFAKTRIEGATPLSQYVDKWVDHMRGADRRPGGMLLDKSPTTGRLQERTIQWSADERRELKKLGFVETDVAHMVTQYSQDMGGEIALHKAFNGKGRDEVMRDMNRDYQAAVDATSDPKEIKSLNLARKKNEADILAGWDRIKGQHDMTDNNGLTWFADKIGKLGLLRYVGGFVFGAANDIATASMAARGGAGGLVKHLATFGADTRYILAQAKAGDPGMRELAKIFGTFENAAHMAVSDRAFGNGSASNLAGVGTGMTRTITAKIDTAMGMAADKANMLSGLKGWSDATRRAAGLVQLSNLSEWTRKGWANLSTGQQADLLTLGIGETEAKQLGGMFDRYATVHDNGLVSPNMHKWLASKEPYAHEMVDLLTTALEKTQKRASYTSGMGHMPLLMDKWYGKLFLQFQSYAFQFTSNFMRAGAQRGALTPGDMKHYQAAGLALAGGVLTAEIANWRKGGTSPDRTSKQYAYQVFQRSGIAGYLGSYSDAGVKLLAPSMTGNTSKFGQNSWLANLLGPGMGTIETLGGIGADAARGDWSPAGKKAKTLLVMRQQYDAINRLFGDQ